MEVMKLVILIIASLVTLTWGIGIRSYIRRGEGLSQQTVNITMLFAISIILVLILKWSYLNLLWLFPISIILGMLSLAFPFSLITIPGRWFCRFWCVGLNQDEVYRNNTIRERISEYQAQGMSVEEARKKIKDEFF